MARSIPCPAPPVKWGLLVYWSYQSSLPVPAQITRGSLELRELSHRPAIDRRLGNTGRVRPVQEIRKVVRGATPTHEHLRSRVTFVAVATVLLDAVASVLILAFERHASRTEITNLGDAVFWT